MASITSANDCIAKMHTDGTRLSTFVLQLVIIPAQHYKFSYSANHDF